MAYQMSAALQEKLKRSSRHSLSQITPKRFCNGFLLQSARQYEATLTSESPASLDNSNVSVEELSPLNSTREDLPSLDEFESDSEAVVELTNKKLVTILNRYDKEDLNSTTESCDSSSVSLSNLVAVNQSKSVIFRPMISKTTKSKSRVDESELESACLNVSDSAACSKTCCTETLTPSPVQLVPRVKPFTSSSVKSKSKKSIPERTCDRLCDSSDDSCDVAPAANFKCMLCANSYESIGISDPSVSQDVPSLSDCSAMLSLAEKEEKLRKLKLVKTYRTKNDLQQLNKLIVKWRQVAQEAVMQLYEVSSEPKGTLSDFINCLQVDCSLVHFNHNTDSFN